MVRNDSAGTENLTPIDTDKYRQEAQKTRKDFFDVIGGASPTLQNHWLLFFWQDNRIYWIVFIIATEVTEDTEKI